MDVDRVRTATKHGRCNTTSATSSKGSPSNSCSEIRYNSDIQITVKPDQAQHLYDYLKNILYRVGILRIVAPTTRDSLAEFHVRGMKTNNDNATAKLRRTRLRRAIAIPTETSRAGSTRAIQK